MDFKPPENTVDKPQGCLMGVLPVRSISDISVGGSTEMNQ